MFVAGVFVQFLRMYVELSAALKIFENFLVYAINRMLHVQILSSRVQLDFELSACPAYSGLADFGLEKTLPLYFVDEKHLVGI